MLVLSKSTVLNPSILETRSLPRKFFRRVTVFPRGASVGTWIRIIAENQFLRYMLALTPVLLLLLVWDRAALLVAHAPLPMVALIMLFEMRILRLSKAARERLVSDDVAARRLDLLAFRGRGILRRIAARRGVDEGALHLVIEQSELARISPLTFVTVQSALPKPHILDLHPAEMDAIHDGLFDKDLTEDHLRDVNLAQGVYVRDVQLETRSVSARARLAAWMEDEAGAAEDNMPEGARA